MQQTIIEIAGVPIRCDERGIVLGVDKDFFDPDPIAEAITAEMTGIWLEESA